MESLPSILFQVGEIDLGDLQFVQDRVDAGEWLEAHGSINAVTNEISIIPASGKTFYAYKGKIVITGHVSPAGISGTVKNEVEAAVKVDGTVKDSTNLGFSSTSSVDGITGRGSGTSYGHTGDGRFDVLGLSLVGNGVKKVTIENIIDDGTADATLSGWIKTT